MNVNFLSANFLSANEQPFVCPLCQSSMQLSSKNWRCSGDNLGQNAKQTQHSFDVAKQGYVNLLPVQQKKSTNPGDSQASIEARRRFLIAGNYQPLQAFIAEKVAQLFNAKVTHDNSDAVIEGSIEGNNDHPSKNEQLKKYSNVNAQQPLSESQTSPPIWADIGCGEGYYTLAIAESLAQVVKRMQKSGQPPPLLDTEQAIDAYQATDTCRAIDERKAATMVALDISKPAVVSIAKTVKANQQLWYQQPNSTLNPDKAVIYPIVASAANLPLADQSLDGISSIFSPILPDAFADKLKQGGWLLIAKPDVGHLQSLREALFDEVREHDSDKFLTQLEPYFKLTAIHHIEQSLTLNIEALADLLTMTPYSYRAQPAKREALLSSAKQSVFITQAKFVLYILQKR